MSVLILITLCLIFAGSWITFWILVLRSTEHRLSVALREWGGERNFRVMECREENPPAPLDAVAAHRLVFRLCVGNESTKLIRFKSFPPAGRLDPGDGRAPTGVWNIFVRDLETHWPPTALRPSSSPVSVLDLFSLTSFPSLGASERFIVFGTESRAASALFKSPARGLLPPDIGLMLHGKTLLLDFSARPFDTIEFERMIAVANQLVAHLPAQEG